MSAALLLAPVERVIVDSFDAPCATPGCRARTLSAEVDLCVDCEDARDRARALQLVPAVLEQLDAEPTLSLTEALGRAEARGHIPSSLSMALFCLVQMEWRSTMHARGPVAAAALRARLAAEPRAA